MPSFGPIQAPVPAQKESKSEDEARKGGESSDDLARALKNLPESENNDSKVGDANGTPLFRQATFGMPGLFIAKPLSEKS